MDSQKPRLMRPLASWRARLAAATLTTSYLLQPLTAFASDSKTPQAASSFTQRLPAHAFLVGWSDFGPGSNGGYWLSMGMGAVIMAAMVLMGVGIWMQMKGRFGKKHAPVEKPTTKFTDVAGIDEVTDELKELVLMMLCPQDFTAKGAHIPKGTLLVGPPGVGKTLVAKAVAGEAGVPFFAVSGAEFDEMFVGVGTHRLKSLFEQAAKNAPSIIYIDEIESLCQTRSSNAAFKDERDRTLTQFLTMMDGFASNSGVIVIASTNRPDMLDPAVTRPGRFDRIITVRVANAVGREAQLRVHTRGKPVDHEVSFTAIANQTAGFSGAQLAGLVNEAAILAVREGSKTIKQAHFDEGFLKTLMGPKLKSIKMSAKDEELTAYHEAGHFVAGLLAGAGAWSQISIVPRANSMGQAVRVGEDRYFWAESEIVAELKAAYGGMVAEKILRKETTSGPSNDLQKTRQMVDQMVDDFGMSKLGPRTYTALSPHGQAVVSQRKAERIDDEKDRIHDNVYQSVEEALTKHWAAVEAVANRLRNDEDKTVSGKELEELAWPIIDGCDQPVVAGIA